MDQQHTMMWQQQSEHVRCTLVVDQQVRLRELTDLSSNQQLVETEAAFVALACDECTYEPPVLASATQHMVHIRWNNTINGSNAELHVSLDKASIRWRLVLSGEHRWRVRFPFLAVVSDCKHVCCDEQKRAIFYRTDWPLPCVWLGPDDRTLTLFHDVTLPSATGNLPELWSESGVAIIATKGQPIVIALELALHTGGWFAAFDLFRSRVRSTVDLAQYQRPDLAWYQDQLVQHFTFLYGREILNLKTGLFELDRLLDDGERDFGGYDGLLLWGGYPRLGIDERTQWDFFDDLPGGRAGIQALAQEARKRGTRLFVPYKPWDRSADLHGSSSTPDHEQLAYLIADVEADGVFLDTLSALSGMFREHIDQARIGVVLCSEGRARGAALATITSSWDQQRYVDTQQGNWSAAEVTMPAVNLQRFLFPEHKLFVIGRHALGDNRMHAIQRGFFNGMGWVVWQDVFGLASPYTPAEAALLKRCRIILREHLDVLHTPTPTPLVETLVGGVYANLFATSNKRLWTVYNSRDEAIDIPVLYVQTRPDCVLVDAWAQQEVMPDQQGRVQLVLEPHGIGALVEHPLQSSGTAP